MRGVALSALAASAAAQSATINVDWSATLRPLQTVAAFQTVVNRECLPFLVFVSTPLSPAPSRRPPSPLAAVTARDSPYHDAVYDKIASLGAQYQRYVPWLPYPRMGIAELEPPSHGGLCGFVNSGGPGNIWSTTLDCGARGAGTIDSVVFADYGKPTGFCNALQAGACTKDVKAAVAAACVGKAACTLLSSDATFGAAPCGGNRLAVEVTCSNKAVGTFTYWDFEVPDQGMQDFLTAAGSEERATIPNFSTIPNWLFVNPDRSYFPDDPLGETWGYESGREFRDPTLKDLGDYYGRLVAHYVEGGFSDEAGNFIPGHNWTISHWEVLNEIEGEHGLSPELYTRVYDAIVAGIRRWAPRGSANMKFMALALENSGNYQYVSYFLNASNHVPGVPIDFVSFHHYAGAASRAGGANGSDYEAFFPSGDSWLTNVATIQGIRDALNPSVMLDADEVGVILPSDNDPKYTSLEPGFPAIYWNAAAAMFVPGRRRRSRRARVSPPKAAPFTPLPLLLPFFSRRYAYLFGRTAVLGLDVLGESQLIGYPSIPFSRGPPINGAWTAPPQFPSVSLLSWGGAFGKPGDGTARYWALKLLVDSFTPGPPAGRAAPGAADWLVNTTVSGGGGPGASPFCGSIINLQDLSLACFSGVISAITFASYGTPTGACGTWAVNASCNDPNSLAAVRQQCVGKPACTVTAGPPNFGDPCFNTVKHLDVEATCSAGGGAQVTSAAVYAQAFTEAAGTGARKVLVVNTKSTPQSVTLAGAKGATWAYLDESAAYGPAQTATLAADTWLLAPFALGVLRL
jgi:hypothetical protein